VGRRATRGTDRVFRTNFPHRNLLTRHGG